MLERADLLPLFWQSDGAFLLNDQERTPTRALPSLVVRWHHNRIVNAALRHLRLGSIIFVQAKKA
jgi:hypothetical protein